jgi:integrase
MKRRLTDGFVKTVALPKKDGQRQQRYIENLERGLSLVLQVSYSGTKSFNALTYKDGKPQSFKLGQYPEMTVKEARQKAEQYRANPNQFKQKDETDKSFEAIAKRWFKEKAAKFKTADNVRRILETYVYPGWRKKLITEIRRTQVTELLEQVVDRKQKTNFRKDGAAQHDAVLSVVRSILKWYGDKFDEFYKSPVTAAMRRVEQKQSARERILTDEEIRQLWNVKTNEQFTDLVKVCLLTAQRRDKVATMKWTDIKDSVLDETSGKRYDDVWEIRADNDRDKGTGGILKLPFAAMHIIENQPRKFNNPYVFGVRGGKPFRAFGNRKAELDKVLKFKEPWVIHDLRRTARSLMPRAGVSDTIAERVLGHVQGGVKEIYNRHKYTNEKADALDRLATLIATIVTPNVIDLQEKKKVAMNG